MKKAILVIALTASIMSFADFRDKVCVYDHYTKNGKHLQTDTLYRFPIDSNYEVAFKGSDSSWYFISKYPKIKNINWDYSTYYYDSVNVKCDCIGIRANVLVNGVWK